MSAKKPPSTLPSPKRAAANKRTAPLSSAKTGATRSRRTPGASGPIDTAALGGNGYDEVTDVGDLVEAAEGKSTQTIATVERALDVLLLFAAQGTATLGVTEIAGELSMSKAAVHRVLSSLRAKGFVDLDDEERRYRLGAATMTLGLTYLESLDVRSMALPVLKSLSALTFETATLSTRVGDVRSYIDQVLPDREVKMTVPLGRPFPLHTGSSSKAFLAFLSASEIDRYLDGELERYTDLTVIEPAKLRKDLAVIRKNGFAVSLGERQAGAGSVAAPIFDRHGEPIAVMSVCGPVERFRDEVQAISSHLLLATQDLSTRFGARK